MFGDGDGAVYCAMVMAMFGDGGRYMYGDGDVYI